MTQQDRTVVQYHKMTETPIPRLILSLAAPTILSMLITSIYNLADTFFVGRISTSASGAVGVVSSLMAIIQALGFMLGHGSGTIISRRLGSQDTHAATRFASTSFFTALAFGVVLAVGAQCSKARRRQARSWQGLPCPHTAGCCSSPDWRSSAGRQAGWGGRRRRHGAEWFRCCPAAS